MKSHTMISPSLLTDAISSLQQASACKSCGRLPYSSSPPDENDDGNRNHNLPLHTHGEKSIHYRGPLLLSQSCGHLSCSACWNGARKNSLVGNETTLFKIGESPNKKYYDAITTNEVFNHHTPENPRTPQADATSIKNDNTSLVHCPVCHCPSNNVSPILPWLMQESHSRSVSCRFNRDKRCEKEEKQDNIHAKKEIILPIEKIHTALENQLGTLVGMLQQLAGGPSTQMKHSLGGDKAIIQTNIFQQVPVSVKDVKMVDYSSDNECNENSSSDDDDGYSDADGNDIDNNSLAALSTFDTHDELVSETKHRNQSFESEVPGTCLPIGPPMVKLCEVELPVSEEDAAKILRDSREYDENHSSYRDDDYDDAGENDLENSLAHHSELDHRDGLSSQQNRKDQSTESEVPGTCLPLAPDIILQEGSFDREIFSVHHTYSTEAIGTPKSNSGADRDRNNRKNLRRTLLDHETELLEEPTFVESEVPGTCLTINPVILNDDNSDDSKSINYGMMEPHKADCINSIDCGMSESPKALHVNQPSMKNTELEVAGTYSTRFNSSSYDEEEKSSEQSKMTGYHLSSHVHCGMDSEDGKTDGKDGDSTIQQSLSIGVGDLENIKLSANKDNARFHENIMAETEVPETLLDLHIKKSTVEDFDEVNHNENSTGQKQCLMTLDAERVRPRCVSASPNKKGRIDPTLNLTNQTTTNNHIDTHDAKYHDTLLQLPDCHESISNRDSKRGILPDIRPWNLYSEPAMSPLTCEVGAVPGFNSVLCIEKENKSNDAQELTELLPEVHQNDDICRGNIYPPLEKSHPRSKSSVSRKSNPALSALRQMYIAYNVLDSVEASSLKAMHEQGLCQVVSGICSIPINKKAGAESNHTDSQSQCVALFAPFPTILVVHAMDRPAFHADSNALRTDGTLTRKTIPICFRSYEYVKAMALGARIIDARWLIDSHSAGSWMDCASYEVWGDVDTYNALSFRMHECEQDANGSDSVDIVATKARSLQRRHHNPLDRSILSGLTFGLIQSCQISESSLESNFISRKYTKSQLRAKTQALSSVQIISLVEFCGGRISTDASSDALMQANILLVPDEVHLDQVVKDLNSYPKRKTDAKWSIEHWNKKNLEIKCITKKRPHENSMTVLHSDDKQRRNEGILKLPVIQTKWLEDSICIRSLQCLEKYCLGMLSCSK